MDHFPGLKRWKIPMPSQPAIKSKIHQANLNAFSYHITYAFQSESTRYSCLNAKELLARNRCETGSLSECNWTRTHNHLVHKQTLNHLAKLAKSSFKCSVEETHQKMVKFWTQEVLICYFNSSTARIHRVDSVSKIMPAFMSIKVIKF